MLLIVKRFLKVNGCRASEFSVVTGTPQRLFGGDFITNLHCLGTSTDSSCHFLLAMESRVGIVLKDSLPHGLEIMYIRGNTKARFCGGTFWKDINH